MRHLSVCAICSEPAAELSEWLYPEYSCAAIHRLRPRCCATPPASHWSCPNSLSRNGRRPPGPSVLAENLQALTSPSWSRPPPKEHDAIELWQFNQRAIVTSSYRDDLWVEPAEAIGLSAKGESGHSYRLIRAIKFCGHPAARRSRFCNTGKRAGIGAAISRDAN